MTKKIFKTKNVLAIAICLAGITIFSGCKKELPFVGVTSISDVPTTATAGTPLTLKGTVNPDNATNKKIVWSIVNTGLTEATLTDGNILNATTLGTVVVQASITNGRAKGSDYIHHFPIIVNATPFSGDGKSDNPYLITNAAQLAQLAILINSGVAPYNGADVHYKQTANISLSDNWTPIAIGLRRFFGIYNGSGFFISGLTISGSSEFQGLFGYVGFGGEVRNIALTNVKIESSNSRVGGVAGRNNGKIEFCYVSGSEGINGKDDVGGVVGRNDGTVENCYATCNVTGNNYVGGVVGGNAISSTSVNKCYATGIIIGADRVGGVIGNNGINGNVSNCVALNPSVQRAGMSTETNFGRVAGIGMATNSAAYSDMSAPYGISIVNDANGKDGLGIDKETAKTRNTYESRGWAFGTSDAAPWRWGLSTSYKLPTLYWQSVAPSLPGHLN